MKGNRDKIKYERLPDYEVIELEKEYQVRFNFVELPKEDDREASYNYDYVNVKEVTKKALKSAIIKIKYPDIDDEIAVLNNKDKKPDEYIQYQIVRSDADIIVDLIID